MLAPDCSPKISVDAAKKANPDSRLFGFLLGPDGIIENRTVEITRQMVDDYRNLGGFCMIKTGRTKIDTEKKMAMSRATCKQLGLEVSKPCDPVN